MYIYAGKTYTDAYDVYKAMKAKAPAWIIISADIIDAIEAMKHNERRCFDGIGCVWLCDVKPYACHLCGHEWATRSSDGCPECGYPFERGNP